MHRFGVIRVLIAMIGSSGLEPNAPWLAKRRLLTCAARRSANAKVICVMLDRADPNGAMTVSIPLTHLLA